MKEKLWIFDYTTNRVLCCYIDCEQDVDDYLDSIGLKRDDVVTFVTPIDVELEILS